MPWWWCHRQNSRGATILNSELFYENLERDPLAQEVVAFAMTLYACEQVHHIAQTQGPSTTTETLVLNTFIESTLNLNPHRMSDLLELYTLGNALQLFYELMNPKALNRANPRTFLRIRQTLLYSQGVLKLKTLIFKAPKKLELLENRLQIIARFRQLNSNDSTLLSTLTSKLATLYLDVFGDLRFRIIVQGTAEALQNEHKVEHIRCLLLCAIRFAVLWDQVGGKRWKLLFQRGKIRTTIDRLRQHIAAIQPVPNAGPIHFKP